jgi:hypothetical protein
MKQTFYQKQINQKVDVLWESRKVDDSGKAYYSGYAPNFCRVESNDRNEVLLEGRIKTAKLMEYSVSKSILKGETVNENTTK